MSILNVDQISPIGSGSTITVTATETKTGDITIGTGTSIFSPAGNTLVLGTNNSERIRIKNDGKVGVGTNNPTAKLEIKGSDNPLVKIVQDTSGIARLNLESSTNDGYQYSGIGLGDGTNDAELMWTTGGFDINVGNAVRLRINSNGAWGAGTNFGSAGQVLTSQGSGSPVQWATPSLPTLPHAFVFMDSQYFTSSVTLLEFNNSTANDRSSGVTITRGGSERFTPTVAGTYFVQAHLTYSHGGGVYTPVLYIYRNGSGYSSLSSSGIVNYGGGHNDSLSCQAMMTFNGTSDYVDMRASHNGGGNATMKSYSTFAMFRVGA